MPRPQESRCPRLDIIAVNNAKFVCDELASQQLSDHDLTVAVRVLALNLYFDTLHRLPFRCPADLQKYEVRILNTLDQMRFTEKSRMITYKETTAQMRTRLEFAMAVVKKVNRFGQD